MTLSTLWRDKAEPFTFTVSEVKRSTFEASVLSPAAIIIDTNTTLVIEIVIVIDKEILVTNANANILLLYI